MTSLLDEIPKELVPNLERRGKLLAAAEKNVKLQHALIEQSREDPLFWLNTFVFIFEPRKTEASKKPRKLPFITWPHQDVALRQMLASFGDSDVVIDKSRGEGASWIVLMLYLHHWLFHEMMLFGVTSRTLLAADNPSNQGSLMWKLTWALDQLPFWMIPKKERSETKHTLRNLENGSCITAHACTDDMAVGDRYFSFFMDELSRFQRGDDYTAWTSTQAVTDCRIACGTPFGPAGQYFDLVHDTESELVKIVLDWKDNPTKTKGMYRVVEGRVIENDPANNPLPAGYVERCKGPHPDGKAAADRDERIGRPWDIHARLHRKGFALDKAQRSPWYDRQCLRASGPQAVAQEIDRSFTGHDWPYMNPQLIQELEVEIRPPYHRGRLTFDPETLEPTFHEDSEGPLLLWVNLTHDGEPPLGRYAQGSDVSMGTAGAFSSLSTTEGFNSNTGEQAYEFTSREMKPEAFGRYNIALAKWFHNAIMNWEANGPGQGVTTEVQRFHYGNAFQRETKEEHGPKVTAKLGTHMQNNKIDVMGGWGTGAEGFADAVESRKCIIRSAELLKECGEYVFKAAAGGRVTIAHISDTKNKGSAGGKDHGDRVVGAALAWLAAASAPKPKDPEDLSDKIPYGCLKWRERKAQEDEEARDQDADPWDF